MRSTNKRMLSLFLLSFFLNNTLAKDTVTHCSQDETPLFSCTMHNKKILSLCSAENNKFLTYRYGKYGQPEFSYSDRQIAADNVFSYAHYFRYRTDYFLLIFTNQNYQYDVFRYYSDDGSTDKPLAAGINITNTFSGKEYINECASIEKDSLLILQDFLPCNKTTALGCRNE